MSELPERSRRKVFVVEDESLIVMMLRDMLDELGHECVAVSNRLVDAIEIAEQATYDLAILDVNVKGDPSYPIADLVAARGLPFIFATGYGLQGIEPAYRSAPILQKPFDVRALRAAIELAIAGSAAPDLDVPPEHAS